MALFGKVSVVMPAFNSAATLYEAVESVRRQTYLDWELLIVDDCSSDETEVVLDKIKEMRDGRIRILRNHVNQGAAASRNRALREATGRWIAFLDSDDIWLPEKLFRQLQFMNENDCSFSYTDYEHIDHAGERMRVRVSGPDVISHHSFRRYCWVGCLTVMYDSSKTGLMQIPSLKNREDYALWLRVSEKLVCKRLPEVQALYRKGVNGSQSSIGLLKLISSQFDLFREAEDQSVPHAAFSTARNLLFGTYKKTRFVRSF